MAAGINSRRGKDEVDSRRLAPSRVIGRNCRRADIFWIRYHRDNRGTPPVFAYVGETKGLRANFLDVGETKDLEDFRRG